MMEREPKELSQRAAVGERRYMGVGFLWLLSRLLERILCDRVVRRHSVNGAWLFMPDEWHYSAI